ncbi:leucine-rich repeat flightless-interacting protein 2 isoform X24 [Carassius gibelio]|uniref:leucine-rich repeat flightless-interacting protein 2 isoform X24 n=1 Tax=Carassius gibelio TaxID=101364 RepID=UPI0022795B9B|nr:leucine-rich repeat flightless-interacting protein 2 isoform X24 [Carassius gibelio]
MGSQGPGRRRTPSKNGLTGEEDALNVIAKEAEARLAAKRAARAEAREIRMRELERQQKEIYQVQKKYYGLDNLDNKWGDIEQWMEDSERYTRVSRRHASVSDDEEQMSVGSRSNIRLDLDAAGAYGVLPQASSYHKKSKKKKKHSSKSSNGYDDDLSTVSSRSSRLSDESKISRSSRLDQQSKACHSSELYSSSSYSSKHQAPSYNRCQSSLLHSRKHRGSVYEDSLYSGSRRPSARASSEYGGFPGSSSRTSSRANSACGSPVADDRLERDYLEKGSSRASTISGATLTSLGGTSSRRGSGDTAITADTEASIREIKDSLLEVEEKYRKAMVSNAQLDNEKTNMMYEVDTLKDSLMELEEMLFETRRELEEKCKDLEREKHAHSILQFQFSELKETLKQSEELLTEIRQLRLKQDGNVREISDLQETIEWKNKKIGALERQKEFSDAIRNERDELRDEVVQLKDILKKHGIVLGLDLATNGETDEVGKADQNSQTASAEIREGSSVLEIRLRKLVDERENLIEQVKRLKGQLEQKKQKNGMEDSSSPQGDVLENGADSSIMDIQRDAIRQINDLKFKLVKSEQEVTALEQNVTRLEGHVTRYKAASENAEKVEDELKAEKRKMQRELRSALDKIEELESSNSHLSKRLEKMKSGRGTATP